MVDGPGPAAAGAPAAGALVVPPAVRAALVAHAAAESPNECCGLVAFKDGVAERYLPGINEEPSPFFFKLRPADPLDFFLEDEGYELAIFHSHLSSPPRPSRTDVENIGQWDGKPYLIYSVRLDQLAAWRIEDGRIGELPLAAAPGTGA